MISFGGHGCPVAVGGELKAPGCHHSECAESPYRFRAGKVPFGSGMMPSESSKMPSEGGKLSSEGGKMFSEGGIMRSEGGI